MAESSISLLPPKSVLHYWLQLSQEPNQDFIRLLGYLSERDLGLLDIALTERNVRCLYLVPLRNYYKIAKIFSRSLFEWILSRGLNNHIQHLEISFNQVNTNIVINLENYNIMFPNLVSIHCECNNSAICPILGLYSPNLYSVEIILSDTLGIIDADVESMCAGCRHLTRIMIAKDSDEHPLHQSGEALASITKYCKELEDLTLSSWEHINSNAIACLSTLTNIYRLSIRSLNCALSFPVEVFSSNMKLESLYLHGEFSHDTIMRALGIHCHSLKSVELSSLALREITDNGFIAMVQGCPLLETIYIDAWNKASDIYGGEFVPTVSVTSASMYAIAQHCLHLEVFSLNSADTLIYDTSGLDAIKECCPHLQYILKDNCDYYSLPHYHTSDPTTDTPHSLW